MSSNLQTQPSSLGFARPAPGRPLAYTPSLGFARLAPGRPLAYTPSLGLTLVEMMVAIAIAGVLAFAAISLTGAWVDSNRLMDSENLLQQGFRQAKAASMRNQFGITGDKPAAVFCFASNTLTVRTATDAATPATCSSANVIWTSTLSDRLSVSSNSAAFSCACLTNKGRLTTATTPCASCISGSAISLQSGNETIDVSLL